MLIIHLASNLSDEKVCVLQLKKYTRFSVSDVNHRQFAMMTISALKDFSSDHCMKAILN